MDQEYFSEALKYVDTLNQFRREHDGRKPKAQVCLGNSAWWKLLIEEKGQQYADDFESWILS